VPSFATVEQFTGYLQTDSVNETAAQLCLDAATALIQAETGQHFFLVEDDQITVRGGEGRIFLPQQPVVSISAVTSRWIGSAVDTANVVDLDYVRWGHELSWAAGGYVRINSSPRWGTYGYTWPEYVTVTYTHGYATIPADVVMCCLQLAAEQYSSPDGVNYESIDDYAWRRTEAGTTPAAYALKGVKARYGQRARMVGVR
jgi:hypothetical protein